MIVTELKVKFGDDMTKADAASICQLPLLIKDFRATKQAPNVMNAVNKMLAVINS